MIELGLDTVLIEKCVCVCKIRGKKRKDKQLSINATQFFICVANDLHRTGKVTKWKAVTMVLREISTPGLISNDTIRFNWDFSRKMRLSARNPSFCEKVRLSRRIAVVTSCQEPVTHIESSWVGLEWLFSSFFHLSYDLKPDIYCNSSIKR